MYPQGESRRTPLFAVTAGTLAYRMQSEVDFREFLCISCSKRYFSGHGSCFFRRMQIMVIKLNSFFTNQFVRLFHFICYNHD